MTRMIIGKYIRNLLEDRTRVILPGFGNLVVVLSEGTKAGPGNRIEPPGLRVKFDSGLSKDDGLLAETMAAGEVLELEEAQQRVLELVDNIKFSLDKGEDFLLPETGTFSRDAGGKVHFRADPGWVLEPDQYGLESMELLELEELPAEGAASQDSGKGTKAASGTTELTPPKPKPKSRKWRVIWMVAAALIVVLVVLILVPSGNLFNRQPDSEVVDQAEGEADQAEGTGEQAEGTTDPQDAETEGQVSDPDPVPQETDTEEEEALPIEESNNFFIIAGSFSKLNNASDLQDQLNNQGYNAEMMITENRMYRVSVASFATKEEAERALAQIKTEPGMQSCWLLSN